MSCLWLLSQFHHPICNPTPVEWPVQEQHGIQRGKQHL